MSSSPPPASSIRRGIACGAAAGAFWGLVFLTPELVRDFTPGQLAAGRYLAYGLFAALLIAPRLRSLLPRLGWREWWALSWLSLLGNTLYYVLLAQAVQLGGMAMTALVIGFLPVAVTLVSRGGAGAVPLRRLALSLALGVAGIGCVGYESLAAVSLGGDAAGLARPGALLGFGCAVGALISWSIYAVANSRWLARRADLSAHDWSLLTGLATGAQALLLAIPAFVLTAADAGGAPAHSSEAWWRFIAVVTSVAILASIVGNAFWNRASRLLPSTMIGQMILFETLFALLYGFAWEQRGPSWLEAAAMVLVTASVLGSVRAHRVHAPAPAAHAA
ncbi:DMT family transporter [Xenophilus arseniciresistens]|uniref:DMT family transporter n=1 Tax=Xenophilus arseniciresistens TaxID=1283306 RepID=A0AAE3NAN3_9BURK|nr:DMT family transporter [Xenophilus arseniciresistens]MDA7418840.1 DMT family transporter [Xenophilus arseniciresistens]